MQSKSKAEEATVETVLDGETNETLTISVDPSNSDKVLAKLKADKELRQSLEARKAMPAAGDPNATVSDPLMANIVPRYRIVQNRSDKLLIIPDLRDANEDSMGLMLNPGQIEVLTDYYTPLQINRSRGLKWAATSLEGLGGNKALVPLNSVEEGESFVLPKKKELPKGTEIIDDSPNDFDLRFEELEAREAKREEKMLKKTLGMRVTKQHGSAPKSV